MFLKICREHVVSYTSGVVIKIQNLVLGIVFLDEPRIAPVIAKQALYWRDSS